MAPWPWDSHGARGWHHIPPPPELLRVYSQHSPVAPVLEHCPASVLGLTASPAEQAMGHNQERLSSQQESRARAQVLSKEVLLLREEKSKQVMPGP